MPGRPCRAGAWKLVKEALRPASTVGSPPWKILEAPGSSRKHRSHVLRSKKAQDPQMPASGVAPSAHGRSALRR